jgi:arsenite methyltransferase
MARVLRNRGRLGISDVVAEDHLTPDQRTERGSYVGCIAGALTFAEYRAGLEAAGFEAIQITPTNQIADGMHSAIVRAVKSRVRLDTSATRTPIPLIGAGGCC